MNYNIASCNKAYGNYDGDSPFLPVMLHPFLSLLSYNVFSNSIRPHNIAANITLSFVLKI
jgi:hypothetical protein